jgi:hypothetical protein
VPEERGAPSWPTSRSRSDEEITRVEGHRLAMLDPVRDHMQGERRDFGLRFGFGRTIG